MKLNKLKNKKILILGLGQEGISSYQFLRKLFPKVKIGLADQLKLNQLKKELQAKISKDKNLNLHLGKDYLENLGQYQIIIKSPGISPFLPQLKMVKNKITSQTKIFFDNCPSVIVGITGTKGKSTMSTLIYQVLKSKGMDVHLVGNIGQPSLSSLNEAKNKSIFVYELSSHQLFDLEKSPRTAILLNIFKEHLDYYQNFDQYAQAKENITRYQKKSDYFIFNPTLSLPQQIAQRTKAKKLAFSIKDHQQSGCYLEKGNILYRSGLKEEKIISVKEIKLKGEFNLLNIMPAIIVGKIFKVPTKSIVSAIKRFNPLEHRLEEVGTYQGITFYNDSLSTVPETAVEAIKALRGKVSAIILGGFERNQDYGQLAQKILESKIKTVILFPTTGQRIWQDITEEKKKDQSLPRYFFTEKMEKAVQLAYQNTPKGKVCLLSPAAPSFNLFKDYKERGDLFKKFVKKFAKSS
jgi:UDP-N-acetylmuramoylalanine--D-glutamate ligase